MCIILQFAGMFSLRWNSDDLTAKGAKVVESGRSSSMFLEGSDRTVSMRYQVADS